MVDIPDSATVAALQSESVKVRRFMRFRGRNRSTDALEWVNFWNGIDTVTAQVMGASDGQVAEYEFLGAGSLISVSEITYVSEQTLTDRSLTIACNILDSTVEAAIRGYDLMGQPVEIYEGLFDLGTNTLVAPARPKFDGFVDRAPITTPKAGDSGSIELTVRDHASEMSRTSLLKRSHASEILRNATDEFYKDAATVGDWKIYWGSKTVQTSTEYKKTLPLSRIQSRIA